MGLLDASGLKAALGDLLNARELKAILERRNLLLQLPTAGCSSIPLTTRNRVRVSAASRTG